MRLPATLLLAACATFFAASPASAVIISGGDGSGNKTAPDGDQGWSYVGVVEHDSFVYLGNGWAITAYHVAHKITDSSTVELDGSSYAVAAGSVQQLTNNYGTLADLAMFQLQTPPPALSGVSIASGDITGVTAIGYGKDRATLPTYWDAGWNETTSSSAVYTGYKWIPNTLTKRWGTNILSGSLPDLETRDGARFGGITDCLLTTFDANGGPNEMQASDGDSGGGVFVQQDGVWNLAGIMLAVGSGPSDITKPDSLATTAVYGDETAFADLRPYAGQIQDIMGVPEPSALALLAAAGIAGGLLWRRKAARRAVVR